MLALVFGGFIHIFKMLVSMVRYCHNHRSQSNDSCTPDWDFHRFHPCEIIRIYHDYEGGIEKICPEEKSIHHECEEAHDANR